MKQYKVKAEGTLTHQDDTEQMFTISKTTNQNDIAGLKQWFKDEVGKKADQADAKAFSGTVTVESREWTPVAEDKPFSGTYSKSETLVIDI